MDLQVDQLPVGLRADLKADIQTEQLALELQAEKLALCLQVRSHWASRRTCRRTPKSVNSSVCKLNTKDREP